jgi:hypothetical protein
MKIRDIICEDISAEEQLGGASLTANLVPVLMFLKKRSDDKGLSPKLSTQSLIQLVQNAGDVTFDYQALVAANENDDAVKELISSFNEEEIILHSDDPDAEDQQVANDGEGGKGKDPQAVVGSMAKKAASKRS